MEIWQHLKYLTSTNGRSEATQTGLGLMVLGPPVVTFYQLFWGRVPLLKSTTESKSDTLILTSLLEDLGVDG